MSVLRSVIVEDPKINQDHYVNLAHTMMSCGELRPAKQLSTEILAGTPESRSVDQTTGKIDDSLAAWAHANLAHNIWLSEGIAGTEEAFSHARQAMALRQHWQQWPFYCAEWGVQNEGHGTHYNNAWSAEAKVLSSKPGMSKVIQKLRQEECASSFIISQLKTFFDRKVESADRNGGLETQTQYRYSPSNYQYGTFFFTGFQVLFESDTIKPYVERAHENGSRFVVLGSNLGNEAIYGALGYDLDTTGYEILCGLVDVGKNALSGNDLGSDVAPIDLVCSDALKADLKDTSIVYVDNEAWDEYLTISLYKGMAEKLDPGAVVIGWKETSIIKDGFWENLGTVAVPASWAGKGSQDVYVLKRSEKPTDDQLLERPAFDGDTNPDDDEGVEGEDEEEDL